MIKRYKHIHFTYWKEGSCNEYWYCINNKSGDRLGIVLFYKDWNQFVYSPSDGSIYSADCLEDIAEFLRELNKKKEQS